MFFSDSIMRGDFESLEEKEDCEKAPDDEHVPHGEGFVSVLHRPKKLKHLKCQKHVFSQSLHVHFSGKDLPHCSHQTQDT